MARQGRWFSHEEGWTFPHPQPRPHTAPIPMCRHPAENKKYAGQMCRPLLPNHKTHTYLRVVIRHGEAQLCVGGKAAVGSEEADGRGLEGILRGEHQLAMVPAGM